MGWQKDFCINHATLVGVVAVLTVIIAVQFFACPVGGGCYNRLSLAAFDLIYMKMV